MIFVVRKECPHRVGASADRKERAGFYRGWLTLVSTSPRLLKSAGKDLSAINDTEITKIQAMLTEMKERF